MRNDPELIPTRPDEHLDVSRLEPWLRDHLSVQGPLSVRQFGGGHANLTYLLAFDNVEYVLRRPPLGPVAPSSHDMAREHRVLARLGSAFPLAPKSVALCQDLSVLGVEFHVMERRQGFVIREVLPSSLTGRVETVRRLSQMIVDTLADLHRVSSEDVGLGDLGRPDGFVRRQMSGWARRWAAAADRPLRDVDQLVTWLDDHMPEEGGAAILHNDYKLDNILVSAEDPAVATAVLDWDMCTRGNPLMDLGYLLNVWIEASDDPIWRGTTTMPSHEPGFLTRREVVERYARRAAVPVHDIRWFYAFGVFKLLVILQQIHIRYLRGQTEDPRFATLGRRVEVLAAKGVKVTRQPEPV